MTMLKVGSASGKEQLTVLANLSVNTDAQVRLLPAVAPSLVRRLPLR